MSNTRKIIAIWIALFAPLAFALKVQILHTNDLHSYLTHIGSDKSLGGYPAIKKLIQKYRSQASEAGMKTLVFDAGDFLEGNFLYKAENGLKTMLAHDKLGFDAVTLGNHDYLMGTEGLDKLLYDSDIKFSLLAANLKVPPRFSHIRQKIKPYKEFNIDGVKIAVLGVTTNSRMYKWRMDQGTLGKPLISSLKYSRMLKKQRKNDFVISLNHLGLKPDRALAKYSRYIDLIISGHSHDLLLRPEYVKSKSNKQVPIVQVGRFGEYIGRMIVDLKPGKNLKVLKYEVLKVQNDRMETDQELADLVADAENDLQKQYSKSYLDQYVGRTEVPLRSNSMSQSFWGDFIADAVRESLKADVGIHTGAFAGFDQPIGPLTMRSIIDSYPRFFELDRDFGWKLYKAKVRGYLLKLVVNVLVKTGAPLHVSGITFDVKTILGSRWATNIRIRGSKVSTFKQYTISLPEGVARGGPAVTRYYRQLLPDTQRTNINIWDSIKKKVRKMRVLTGKLDKSIDRVMVPATIDMDLEQELKEIEKMLPTLN